jgi:hypothetical protein
VTHQFKCRRPGSSLIGPPGTRARARASTNTWSGAGALRLAEAHRLPPACLHQRIATIPTPSHPSCARNERPTPSDSTRARLLCADSEGALTHKRAGWGRPPSRTTETTHRRRCNATSEGAGSLPRARRVDRNLTTPYFVRCEPALLIGCTARAWGGSAATYTHTSRSDTRPPACPQIDKIIDTRSKMVDQDHLVQPVSQVPSALYAHRGTC